MEKKVGLRCPVIVGAQTELDVFIPGIGIVKKNGRYTEIGREFLKEQIEILSFIIDELDDPEAN